VIVHAYEEYGVDCLQRFNGMFAFALYDIPRQELLIARDRAGQKPLYYHHRDGRFLFGSEAKAILESPLVERRCNLRAIDSYLGLRYVPQPETLFEGIRVLPAAHYLRLKDGQLSIRRYWDIPLHEGRYRSEGEYKEAFEELFLDAVKLTLRSDVPVGAYLSGGVDSGLVVAAMTRSTSKLNTFSIGFQSPIDETLQARELAAHLGCTHHEVNATPEDFARLPEAIWHLERPIGDVLILAYFLLGQETGRHVKVVLSGEGADESFAGYSFHKIIKWTEFCSKLIPAFLTKRVAVPLLEAIPVDLLDRFFIYPAHLGKKGQQKTADYLRHYYDRNLNQNYVALKALYDLPERRALYSDEFKALATESWIAEPRDTRGPFLDRLLKLQFDDWLQDNLLLRQDKNTMAHSLELRVPFLDHRIIELAFQMPPRLKVRGLVDKFVERDLARRMLPRKNVKRSKNPFYFPLEYFHEHPQIRDLIGLTLNEAQVKKRGYFDPHAVQFLIDQMRTGEFLYLKQVLSLVILELWHMIFVDKQRMW
jgi:asparagine synthase (glutamine-hydrolysing)